MHESVPGLQACSSVAVLSTPKLREDWSRRRSLHGDSAPPLQLRSAIFCWRSAAELDNQKRDEVSSRAYFRRRKSVCLFRARSADGRGRSEDYSPRRETRGENFA